MENPVGSGESGLDDAWTCAYSKAWGKQEKLYNVIRIWLSTAQSITRVPAWNLLVLPCLQKHLSECSKPVHTCVLRCRDITGGLEMKVWYK